MYMMPSNRTREYADLTEIRTYRIGRREVMRRASFDSFDYEEDEQERRAAIDSNDEDDWE